MKKTKKIARKRINTAQKGASFERLHVNKHITDGAILSGRFAGSKCKGSLKVDVVAIYPDGRVILQQFKNFAKLGNFNKEKQAFLLTPLPKECILVREFIAKGE